jgi:gas vesicle protein
MNRLTMGAALGGLAVYLFDPKLGEERRERVFSLWREVSG